MKNFTLRLDDELHSELLTFADDIGITLSSLVKTHTAVFLNREFNNNFVLKLVNPDVNTSQLRLSLRIPDKFHNKIKNKADEMNLSVNTLINTACRYELDNWNSE